jgi:hypothetical protein
VLAPLCVVAGALLPYAPHYIFNTLPYEDDLTGYFWPVMHRVAVVLRSGSLPLWTTDIFSGFPLLADSEAGTFFPLNWLLIIFNEPLGLVTVLCASLSVSALGMYAFVRNLGVSRIASVLGAWVWSLGGFATGHWIHVSIINSMAPLPWLMLAVDRVLVTSGPRRWRWLIAAAGLHALQWLGGHVQPALMTWWLVGAYLVYRLFLSPMPGSPRRNRLQRLVLLCALPSFLGLIAFGLSAVQMLPTLELAAASARGASADYPFGASYSFSPFDLVSLVSPFFFQHDSGVRWGLWANWETAAYVGMLPLMLALVALLPGHVGQAVKWSPAGEAGRQFAALPTTLPYFFAAVALLSLWLAAGDSTPLSLYRWVRALPLMNLLRAPARFIMLFDYSLALLAALGAHRVLSLSHPFERVRARHLAFAFAMVTAVLLSAVFGMAGLIGANRETTIQWLDDTYRAFPNSGLLHPAARLFDFLQWAVWLGNPRLAFAVLMLLASSLWMMLTCTGRLALRRRRFFAVVLVLADLSYFTAGFWQSIPVAELQSPDAAVQLVRDSANGTRVFSWPRSPTGPDRLLRWGIADANGYSSLELGRQAQIAGAALAYDNRLLDLLNVGSIVLPPRVTQTVSATVPQPSAPLDPHAPMLYIAQGSLLAPRMFILSRPRFVTHVRIVSALEHAPQIEQGTEVARVRLTDPQGHQTLLRIRAGIESAEWALERPDVRGIARHQPAPIAFSFVARDDFNPAYTRHLYIADVAVSAGAAEAMRVSAIELSVETPGINWLIYRIELLGPPGSEAVDPNTSSGLDRFGVSSFEPVGDTNQARIFRNRTALPRARLVTTPTIEENSVLLFGRLTSPEFDPEREVLLEAMPAAAAPSGSAGGAGLPQTGNAISATVALEQVSDTRLNVRVQTDRDTFLVLADTWYEGWSAYDNGEHTPVFRANYVQRAVFLRAGSHTIEFVFEPWSVRAGFLISLSSMVAAALICLATTGALAARAGVRRCA